MDIQEQIDKLQVLMKISSLTSAKLFDPSCGGTQVWVYPDFIRVEWNGGKGVSHDLNYAAASEDAGWRSQRNIERQHA